MVSLFGKYKHPELNTYLFNNGIEIKTQKKTEVLAVEEGAVLFASDFKGYGKTVIIEHSRNFCTVYSHLGEIKVNSGDYINKKEIIGTIDSSLYFEIRLENKPEDPLLCPVLRDCGLAGNLVVVRAEVAKAPKRVGSLGGDFVNLGSPSLKVH